MLKFLANRALKKFADQYQYDVSYMRHMLDASPSAFFKFAKLTSLAQHCDAAPTKAFYAAKLVGAIAEDCGPCTQLVVNMAKKADVPSDQIEAVLKRNIESMHEETSLGFRFADAIVHRASNEEDVREAVRSQWGDASVIDLTLAVQIGRIFPMVKAGLGYAKTCARVTVDDADIEVIKRAA